MILLSTTSYLRFQGLKLIVLNIKLKAGSYHSLDITIKDLELNADLEMVGLRLNGIRTN